MNVMPTVEKGTLCAMGIQRLQDLRSVNMWIGTVAEMGADVGSREGHTSIYTDRRPRFRSEPHELKKRVSLKHTKVNAAVPALVHDVITPGAWRLYRGAAVAITVREMKVTARALKFIVRKYGTGTRKADFQWALYISVKVWVVKKLLYHA